MQPLYRLSATTLVFLALLTTIAWAETRYISDQLVISLRTSPQNGGEIITYLRTDTAVEVVEEAGDYIKVKTKEGETGFIKKHYLTTETPKSIVIRRLQKERDRLASKVSETKDQLSSAKSKTNQNLQELETKHKETRKDLEALQTKLRSSQAELKKTSADFKALQQDAQDVVAIKKERDQFRTSNEELSIRIVKLEKEVGDLTKTGVIKWFLAGAGVLFFGWMIGKMSGGRKRRSLY
jgi:SH3 domain protein